MVFHKTGTGFDLPDGGVSALVDAAFVSYVRPNGTTGYYSLAVCVEDWHQHPKAGEQKIAQISEAVWNSVVESNLLSMNTSAFIAPATQRPQSSFATVSDEESSAFFGLLGEAIIQAVIERMISGENE